MVQAGRIPPVVGAFARRAYGRDNLVIGLPLAYQYLTSLRPDALPADDERRAAHARPRLAAGVSHRLGASRRPGFRWSRHPLGHRRRGVLAACTGSKLAGAVTVGSPAVPVVRDRTDGQQWSGRVALHLPDGLTVGVVGRARRWIRARRAGAVAGGDRARLGRRR